MSDEKKYPSNSLLPHTSLDSGPAQRGVEKSEEDVKPSIQGKVQIKKKTGMKKLSEAFLPGDIHSIINYLVYDLALAKIKECIVMGVEYMFGNPKSSKSSGRSDDHTDYTSFSRRKYVDDPPPTSMRALGNDIVFEYEYDARQVLTDMRDCIRARGYVTVRTFYTLARASSEYTHTNYGWRNLDNVPVYKCAEGYYLGLPRPEYLGR